MLVSVDRSFQNLLGAGDCDGSNLGTQSVSGLDALLFDFRLGLSQDLLTFLASILFGGFNNLVGALVSLLNQRCCLLFGLTQFFMQNTTKMKNAIA